MEQKLAVTERLEKVIILITLLIAFRATVSIAGIGAYTNNPNHNLIVCMVTWMETAAVFVGIVNKSLTCMKGLKWFNIVKILVIAVNLVIIWNSDLDQVEKIARTVFFSIPLVHAIFILSIASRLGKLYEELLKDRQETTLNNGIKCEGQFPNANQGLPSAPAGMAQPNGFPSHAVKMET